MKFNSQICTSREQSERLLELGLKKETADMWYPHFAPSYPIPLTEDDYTHELNNEDDIPAWSLHRMIEMMPTTINNMLWFNATHYTALYDSIDYIKSFEVKDNLYDNIIDCIGWLIKEGYFPKEYLVNQAEIEEHCKGVLEYLDYIREEEMMKDDLKKRKL